MKKQALTIGCVATILLIFSVSSVFSWGSATHAYIGNKIGAKGGLKDFDESMDLWRRMSSTTLSLRITHISMDRPITQRST